MSFRTAKSRLKIDKDCDMGRPKGRLDEGSAGRGGASRGFWSLTGTGRSLTMRPERPAPRRGAADLKAPPHAADPKIKKNAEALEQV